MPAILPDDWKGGFVLLVIVFVLSSFLDNIAAALIGGVMAREVFKGKVHIGYLAAIVAASNAGGSGSVVGDTTTTMMWIDGVSPLERARRLRRGDRRARRLRHSRGAAAAALSADHQGRGAGHAQSTGRASFIVVVILVVAMLANVTPTCAFPRCSTRSRSSALPSGWRSSPPRCAAARLGRSCPRRSRARCSCSRSSLSRLADAGREAARCRRGRRRSASASSRPCSTTSR